MPFMQIIPDNLINNVDIKQKAVKEFSLLTAPI